ncbi:MAG TPA: adenylate/guanylate cyclase domain-containing protein [Candidatus Limnocylindrales bacterium]|nr:adenylate/guanylate cyclase domain-containing protein [Candidatus Limnocylindrales bacterium]
MPDLAFANRLRPLLPAPLRERLEALVHADGAADSRAERDLLRDIEQHLNSLYIATASFLPSYIADDPAILDAQRGGADYGAMRPGAFLFADVSGFTALSERIQQHSGAEGTEVLTSVINDYFTTMLDILAKSDGQLLKFAGDALLAFYPNAGGDDQGPALKAVRTGLRMQQAMQEGFQPIRSERLKALLGEGHDALLTMSIGIARGRLFEALVGSATQRDHVIQGSLPGEAMDAEGVGMRDEVIVAGDIVPLFDAGYALKPLDDGFVQVVGLTEKLGDFELQVTGMRRRQVAGSLLDFGDGDLLRSVEAAATKVERVRAFVAPAVFSELVNSADHPERGERDRYRVASSNVPAATLFIHCTGFAELLADWGDDYLPDLTGFLSRYYTMVQQAVTELGGTLARTDPYKLGFKLLITFGAPIKHEDDRERAVAAALEIQSRLLALNRRLDEDVRHLQAHSSRTLLRDSYVQQRMGLTFGMTFAGEAGWKQRREFTVMGDDVNLAARLMATAKFGEILISENVYERVRHSFTAEPLAPLTLKGKAKPVQAYRVTGALRESAIAHRADEMPFIGHDQFLLTLNLILPQVKRGRMRALGLVGDAGTGKTRIAREFGDMARANAFRVAFATCQERSTRRDVWAYLVAQLLGIDSAAEPAQGRAAVRTAVEALGLPVLTGVIGDLLFGFTLEAEEKREQSLQDLFQMVAKMSPEELKSSGMFGVLRRRQAAEDTKGAAQAGNGDSIWSAVERRTSTEQAIAELIKAAAAHSPLLIVIDDVHQANLRTLAILEFVLTAVRGVPLAFLGTFEPLTVVPPEIRRALKPVQDLMRLDTVPDLNEYETERLAMACMHASEMDPPLRDLVWQRTNGRPLYIEALMRSLQDEFYVMVTDGRARLSPIADTQALPEDVRELVLSRINRLPTQALDLARACAVLGARCSVGALEAVSGFGERAAMDSGIAALLEAQILLAEDGALLFRHGMTQSVIYDSMPRAERLKLHRAAADFYMRPVVDAPIAAAYHLAHCGLLPRAVEIVLNAAEEAEARKDYEGALEDYQFAAGLLPDDRDVLASLVRVRDQLALQ